MEARLTSWLFRGLAIFSTIAVLGIPRLYRFIEVHVPDVMGRILPYESLLFTGLFAFLMLFYRGTMRRKCMYSLILLGTQYVYFMCGLNAGLVLGEMYLICCTSLMLLWMIVSSMWQVPNESDSMSSRIYCLFLRVPLALFVCLYWGKAELLSNSVGACSYIALAILVEMFYSAGKLDRKIGPLIGEDVYVEESPWGPSYRRKVELLIE